MSGNTRVIHKALKNQEGKNRKESGKTCNLSGDLPVISPPPSEKLREHTDEEKQVPRVNGVRSVGEGIVRTTEGGLG